MILDIQCSGAERQFAQHGMIIRVNIDEEEAEKLQKELEEKLNKKEKDIQHIRWWFFETEGWYASDEVVLKAWERSKKAEVSSFLFAVN